MSQTQPIGKIQKKKETHTSLFETDEIRLLCLNSPELILHSLGFDTDGYGNVQCECPIHNGDNRMGFSYNSQKGIWSCFTGKCHERLGNDLIGLVRGIKNYTFPEACKYIRELCNPLSITSEEIGHQLYVKKKRAPKGSTEPLNNELLDGPHNIPLLLNKGFSIDVLNQFKIIGGETVDYSCRERYAVPIIDETNELRGYTCRHLRDGVDPKWLNYPMGLKKEEYLFGLNLAKASISETKEVNIVEGPHDVMRLHDYGYPNTIGLLGTTVSISQIRRLMRCGCRQANLLLDPDQAGLSASTKIAAKLEPYFKTVNLTAKLSSDPDELSLESIYSILGKSKCKQKSLS